MATVSSESVFLEPGLRQRVDEAALVIRNAEDLIGEAYEISVGWAAHVAFQEVHNATAAWLRGDRLPERSELMCDFILAAERAEEYFDQMYYESVGIEVEAAQRAWRDANAEELTRIRGRGPRSGGY